MPQIITNRKNGKLVIEASDNTILTHLMLIEVLTDDIDSAMYADETVPCDERETFDDICTLIFAYKRLLNSLNSALLDRNPNTLKWLEREVVA